MLNVRSKPWFKPGMKAKDGHKGCLCCPGPTDTLKMNTRMSNGFGGWTILKDGKLVYSEMKDYDEAPTLQKFENMARREPESEWVAELYLPLRGATYQRHGRNMWVLVETNMGFA